MTESEKELDEERHCGPQAALAAVLTRSLGRGHSDMPEPGPCVLFRTTTIGTNF